MLYGLRVSTCGLTAFRRNLAFCDLACQDKLGRVFVVFSAVVVETSATTSPDGNHPQLGRVSLLRLEPACGRKPLFQTFNIRKNLAPLVLPSSMLTKAANTAGKYFRSVANPVGRGLINKMLAVCFHQTWKHLPG